MIKTHLSHGFETHDNRRFTRTQDQVVALSSVGHSLRVRALGLTPPGASAGDRLAGVAPYTGRLAIGGLLLALFETTVAEMRVFRVSEFLGAALMLGLLGTLLLSGSRSL